MKLTDVVIGILLLIIICVFDEGICDINTFQFDNLAQAKESLLKMELSEIGIKGTMYINECRVDYAFKPSSMGLRDVYSCHCKNSCNKVKAKAKESSHIQCIDTCLDNLFPKDEL